MPKLVVYGLLVIIVLALIPPALVAQARATNSAVPRIHLIQDMDNEWKYRAQHPNELFADGRAMRPPVPGTVARGQARLEDHLHRGLVGGTWAETFPPEIEVDRAFVERGQSRFNIYCQPCHGMSGYGDGIVNLRGMQLVASGTNGTAWVSAKSLHEQAIRDQPVGQVYNTITNGVRTMAGYRAQVPTEDRWAIVAYVKALQRSQHARQGDVRPEERERMQRIPLSRSGQTP